MKALIQRNQIDAIVASRNSALEQMEAAIQTLERGHALADEAHRQAHKAHHGAVFYHKDRSQQDSYRRIFKPFNKDSSLATYRHDLDARVWTYLLKITGIESLMDRQEKESFRQSLLNDEDVPPVTVENAVSLFERLSDDATLIFQRGLARVFIELDRRFKSHDAFKLGSRIILTHVFNEWGSIGFRSSAPDTIADVERVFALLDDEAPDTTLMTQIQADRNHNTMSPRQSETLSTYFKIRCFKNGNAHLWFTRDDLMDKANQVLADYYGPILPDAVPAEAPKPQTTALARKLQFYATPTDVVCSVLQPLDLKDCRVLEPSAGEGAFVKALTNSGAAHVTAVEVHPDRARAIPRHPKVEVIETNFLTLHPTPTYDHVVMNPPFSGTHWMDHIKHAFGFLKPRGTLTAILPATAEVGNTPKHLAFRRWAEDHSFRHHYSFRDLPPESFSQSGTRINTVVLTLQREKTRS